MIDFVCCHKRNLVKMRVNIIFQKCINFNFNAPGSTFCNVRGCFFVTLVMGLAGIDVIFKLATSHKLDI